MSRWEPVGESYQHKWRGTTLTYSRYDGGNSPVIVTESRDGTHIILLPDDLRLCRLNETEVPPTVPNARVRAVLRKVLRKERITIEMSDIDAALAWLDSAGTEEQPND